MMLGDARFLIAVGPVVQAVCALVQAGCTVVLAYLTWRYVLETRRLADQAVKQAKDASSEQEVEGRRRRDRAVLAVFYELRANLETCTDEKGNQREWKWGSTPVLLAEQYSSNAWALTEAGVARGTRERVAQAYAWVKTYNLSLQATGAAGRSNADGLMTAAESAWRSVHRELQTAVNQLRSDRATKALVGKAEELEVVAPAPHSGEKG